MNKKEVEDSTDQQIPISSQFDFSILHVACIEKTFLQKLTKEESELNVKITEITLFCDAYW